MEAKPFFWDSAELDLLHSLAASTPVRDLVPIIGRSKHAIVGKIRTLGIKRYDQRAWRPEEIEALRSADPASTISALAHKLQCREGRLRILAGNIGVHLRTLRPWSAAEEILLKDLAGILSVAAIAARIERTEKSVRARAVALGISLRHKVRGERRRSCPAVVRTQQPKQHVTRPAKPSTAYVTRIEYCPQCHAPVSDWSGHFQRLGHRRPSA